MKLFLRETPSEILARIRGVMVLKKHPVGIFTFCSTGGFIGKIDGSAFWIQKTLSNYPRGFSQRYFRGTVEEVDGGTMLRGKWKFPMRNKIATAIAATVVFFLPSFVGALYGNHIFYESLSPLEVILIVLFWTVGTAVMFLSGIHTYRKEEQAVIAFLEGLGSSGAETHE